MTAPKKKSAEKKLISSDLADFFSWFSGIIDLLLRHLSPGIPIHLPKETALFQKVDFYCILDYFIQYS